MTTDVRKQPEFDAPALEAAARALALQARVSEMEARGYNGNHASEYADEWWRSHLDRARHCLTAYLSAMSEKGFRLMPRDPTDAMHREGMDTRRHQDSLNKAYGVIIDTSAVWRAMFDSFANLIDAVSQTATEQNPNQHGGGET